MRRWAALAKAAGATARAAKGARPKLSMSRKPPTFVVMVSDQIAEQIANALAATSTRWVKPGRIGGRGGEAEGDRGPVAIRADLQDERGDAEGDEDAVQADRDAEVAPAPGEHA